MATPTQEIQQEQLTGQPEANTAQEQQAESLKKSGVDSQITKSFQALSGEQKKLAGTQQDFQGAVEQQMQRADEAGQNLGITEEAAIGNVITELDNKVAPPTIMGTDKAEKFVDKTKSELDQLDQQEKDFQPQTPPPSQVQATDEDPELAQANAQIDEEFNQVFNLLEERKATLDTRAQQQVDAITQEFAKRREQLRVFNQNRMKGLSTIGARAGRQRFAQEIQSGILSAEEAAGIERFKELAREEFLARQGVRQAQEDNNFNLMLQQVGLMKEKRAAKQDALDRLQQAQAARQEQINEQNKQQLNYQKYLLDVEKFNQEIEGNNFDRALKIAEQSGRSVDIDRDGNLFISDNLTFENQLKFDDFQLKVDQYAEDRKQQGINNAFKQAEIELNQQGFALNQAKFEENVRQFGLNYAIEQQNVDLKQQQFALDRFENGIQTTFDEVGIVAPDAQIHQEVSNAILNVQTTGGGKIRNDGGWECLEWIQAGNGEYGNPIVKLGTPDNKAGNTLAEKTQSVKQYGLTKEEMASMGNAIPVGAVVITNASDVTGNGQAGQWGHAAIVAGFDANGNMILKEANKNNDGKISEGRVLPVNDDSIVGYLGVNSGKQVGEVGLSDDIIAQAVGRAGGNYIGNINTKANEKFNEVVPIPQIERLAELDDRVAAGMTYGEVRELGIDLSKPKKESDAATQMVLNEKIDIIDRLINSKGLSGSVGPYKFNRIGVPILDKAARQKFAADVNLLISQETIQTLLDLKSQGGTLGALSDQERIMLQNAASNIGTWMQRDDSGNPTGKFEIDEESFIGELNRLKKIAEAGLARVSPDPFDPNYQLDEQDYTNNWLD